MEDSDPVLRALGRLKPVAPNAEREQRVRDLCHREMARRAGTPARLVDAAAVAALFCYLSAVLVNAARLAGLI
jgi:hypothetical protein